MATATANDIKTGVGNWLQSKIMPRLDNKRQFLLGMVYGIAAGKMDTIMTSAAQNSALKALGIIHEDGTVDIDTLYDAAFAQLQAQGKLTMDIPFMGSFTFNTDDLRDLRQCIGG